MSSIVENNLIVNNVKLGEMCTLSITADDYSFETDYIALFQN